MQYLVDIVVVTFNHEKYITKAIDSILEQVCDFNYRIIVGEDFSQDNTRKICEQLATKFPDRFLLLKNNANLGLVRNYKNVLDHCNAKYIAILEGDDYWIDKLKLQKQVDLLESDNSIGLVHTGSYTLFENGQMKTNHVFLPKHMLEGDLFESLLMKSNTISPMTVVFRRELLVKYVDFNYFIINNFKTIDYPLWLAFSIHSKIAYIDKQTAVYRSLKKSVSKPELFEDIEEFYQTSLKIKRYYLKEHPIEGITELEALSPTYSLLAENAIAHGRIDKLSEYTSKILMKGFKNRFLKLSSLFKPCYLFYRTYYFSLSPFLSKVKQFLFKKIY
jgi:glycosyltransferase involved in cell wall biosynthesis